MHVEGGDSNILVTFFTLEKEAMVSAAMKTQNKMPGPS
jgi:hypothetical protein